MPSSRRTSRQSRSQQEGPFVSDLALYQSSGHKTEEGRDTDQALPPYLHLVTDEPPSIFDDVPDCPHPKGKYVINPITEEDDSTDLMGQ